MDINRLLIKRIFSQQPIRDLPTLSTRDWKILEILNVEKETIRRRLKCWRMLLSNWQHNNKPSLNIGCFKTHLRFLGKERLSLRSCNSNLLQDRIRALIDLVRHWWLDSPCLRLWEPSSQWARMTQTTSATSSIAKAWWRMKKESVSGIACVKRMNRWRCKNLHLNLSLLRENTLETGALIIPKH